MINQPCIFECDHLGNDEDRISVLGIVRDDRFPVRICNLLPHDLALRKNQSLGTLVDEPVVGTLSKEDDCTGGGQVQPRSPLQRDALRNRENAVPPQRYR